MPRMPASHLYAFLTYRVSLAPGPIIKYPLFTVDRLLAEKAVDAAHDNRPYAQVKKILVLPAMLPARPIRICSWQARQYAAVRIRQYKAV